MDLNWNPPNVCLLSSWDYRYEPLFPALCRVFLSGLVCLFFHVNQGINFLAHKSHWGSYWDWFILGNQCRKGWLGDIKRPITSCCLSGIGCVFLVWCVLLLRMYLFLATVNEASSTHCLLTGHSLCIWGLWFPHVSFHPSAFLNSLCLFVWIDCVIRSLGFQVWCHRIFQLRWLCLLLHITTPAWLLCLRVCWWAVLEMWVPPPSDPWGKSTLPPH
jgi:hypothetical protein